MTTVIEGVSEEAFLGSNDRLTSEGVAQFNTRLLAAMEARFPGRSYHVVPNGEASGEWNALVAGCNYDLPTDEEREYAGQVSGALCLTDNPSWWTTWQEADAE